MKPSEHCKLAGLKGLKHLSELTKQSEQTLISWHKNQPELFQGVLDSAVKKINGGDFNGY